MFSTLFSAVSSVAAAPGYVASSVLESFYGEAPKASGPLDTNYKKADDILTKLFSLTQYRHPHITVDDQTFLVEGGSRLAVNGALSRSNYDGTKMDEVAKRAERYIYLGLKAAWLENDKLTKVIAKIDDAISGLNYFNTRAHHGPSESARFNEEARQRLVRIKMVLEQFSNDRQPELANILDGQDYSQENLRKAKTERMEAVADGFFNSFPPELRKDTLKPALKSFFKANPKAIKMVESFTKNCQEIRKSHLELLQQGHLISYNTKLTEEIDGKSIEVNKRLNEAGAKLNEVLKLHNDLLVAIGRFETTDPLEKRCLDNAISDMFLLARGPDPKILAHEVNDQLLTYLAEPKDEENEKFYDFPADPDNLDNNPLSFNYVISAHESSRDGLFKAEIESKYSAWHLKPEAKSVRIDFSPLGELNCRQKQQILWFIEQLAGTGMEREIRDYHEKLLEFNQSSKFQALANRYHNKEIYNRMNPSMQKVCQAAAEKNLALTKRPELPLEDYNLSLDDISELTEKQKLQVIDLSVLFLYDMLHSVQTALTKCGQEKAE